MHTPLALQIPGSPIGGLIYTESACVRKPPAEGETTGTGAWLNDAIVN